MDTYFTVVGIKNPKGSVCVSKTRKGLVFDVLDSSLDLSSYACLKLLCLVV